MLPVEMLRPTVRYLFCISGIMRKISVQPRSDIQMPRKWIRPQQQSVPAKWWIMDVVLWKIKQKKTTDPDVALICWASLRLLPSHGSQLHVIHAAVRELDLTSHLQVNTSRSYVKTDGRPWLWQLGFYRVRVSSSVSFLLCLYVFMFTVCTFTPEQIPGRCKPTWQ